MSESIVVQDSTNLPVAFTLDRAQGTNGDVVKLTIRRTKAAARGISEAMIWSQLNGESNFWPFIVAD